MPSDNAMSPNPEDGGAWDVNQWEDEETRGLVELVENRKPTKLSGGGVTAEAVGPTPGVIGRADPKLAPTPSARQSQAGARRLHRVWPARNVFCCRGFCMTGGTDECCFPNLCIWAFLLVPCTVYYYYVFPHLWANHAYPLAGATTVVFLISVGLLLATCCSDPGIIPRRTVILATGREELLKETLGYDLLGVVQDNGRLGVPDDLWRQGYRWCRTCNIIRPPRASHCPDCDNCVLRFDHHCPFMNNCIGQRNYHFFFGFLTSVLPLSLLVIPSILMFFTTNMEESMKGIVRLSATMRLLFYGITAVGGMIVIAAVMSLVLWAYHVYLITSNKTTKEQMKKLDNITEEPTLCAPRGPQLFDPWAWVNPRELQADA